MSERRRVASDSGEWRHQWWGMACSLQIPVSSVARNLTCIDSLKIFPSSRISVATFRRYSFLTGCSLCGLFDFARMIFTTVLPLLSEDLYEN